MRNRIIIKRRELSDELFVMYLIAFKYWKQAEDDDIEKMKIEDYANAFMKPKLSLRSNPKYAPFIPAYKLRDENATKSILSQYFNPSSLTKAIKENELCKKKYVTTNIIVDLSDDVPKVTCSTNKDSCRRLSTALSHLSLKTSFGKTIKLEKPEVVATIDLTAEDQLRDREKNWVNMLRRKARDSQPVMNDIYREPINNHGIEVIDLDESDDETQVIDTPEANFESSNCTRDIVTEANVESSNTTKDPGSS